MRPYLQQLSVTPMTGDANTVAVHHGYNYNNVSSCKCV